MLLASFTLHKVQKYFNGFGLGKKILGGFTRSLRSFRTWMAGYRWLKDTILKSFRPFTFPTGIQLAPDFIMRLILRGCKSGIPCSTRDCSYKRYRALDFWMYMYNYIQIFCSGSCSRLKCILSHYRFQIREHN
jgi:hypothetical protein